MGVTTFPAWATPGRGGYNTVWTPGARPRNRAMKAAFPTLESLAERLSRDGGFADFVRVEAALIAWEPDGSRILGASPAAAELAAMLAGPDGRVAAGLPARPRLAALGSGAAPRAGARLERLRLDPARLAPPVTCACRLATLDDGREVLVTA